MCDVDSWSKCIIAESKMADSGKKRYGLIHNTKPAPGTFVARPSIFGDDSGSEDDSVQQGSSDWVKKAFQKEADKSITKRQTTAKIQKALEEDPTIYQYDEVYDKMEEKKAESKLAKQDIQKKPKYITALLAQAEKRKLENERRTERLVQKEREAEGEQFKDKEAFVTSAYRDKLEEFKKQEEEERYQDQLEALTDVSKQKDLSGFYRQLYRQTVVGEDTKTTNKDLDKEELKEDHCIEKETEENIESDEVIQSAEISNEKQEKTKRLYRKRRASSSSSSESENNLDADSSLSDSSSSDSEQNDDIEKKKRRHSEDAEEEGESMAINKDATPSEPPPDEKNAKEDIKVSEESRQKENEVVIEEEPKPKINIWLKRTVGIAFDEALMRYYARKAVRLQTC